jgi:heptaprenyl diphosphate synthase
MALVVARPATLQDALNTLDSDGSQRTRVIDEIERILCNPATANSSALTPMLAALPISEGKFLRPLLTLHIAKVIGVDASDHAVRSAACVELLHLGSLLHDDIIDQARTRRGRTACWAESGMHQATALGDLLYSRAINELNSLGPNRPRVLGAAFAQACAGELQELEEAFEFPTSTDSYFEIATKKTGSFFALACLLGGLASETPATRSQLRTIETFATALGVAFQIADDWLDVVSSEASAGKTVRADLANGVCSLPLRLALVSGEGKLLSEILARPTLSESDVTTILTMSRTPAVMEAMVLAQSPYLERAAVAARELDAKGAHRDAIFDLIDAHRISPSLQDDWVEPSERPQA